MFLGRDLLQQFIQLMLIYLAYCEYCVKLRRRRKRIWTQEIYTKNERATHGFFLNAFQIIKSQDSDELREVIRMNASTFNVLCSLLRDRLTKQSPRKPIEAECRLVLTLMYLSQGSSWQTLAWTFRMGASTVREIILETCEIIWEELYRIYLAPPSEEAWRRIAVDFFNMTKLPHCVGAIDAKHIRIKCPPKAGSLSFNYKKYHSIVLLAACDSNYTFTAVDMAYGSQSDDGIMAASTFGSKILNETINLPPNECLPNSNVQFPYFFVGDATFPLRKNIMRPYPGRLLPKDREAFNATLSSARNKIENTFGVMSMRWRVLLNTINCFPENAEKIVRAVVVLHNFVKMHGGEYCPPNYVDNFDGKDKIEGLWRKEAKYLPQCKLFRKFNAPKIAFSLRDTLKDFIMNKN